MAAQKIGWPYHLILGAFAIVVSREQCKEWFERIEAGEKPLVLGLFPPVPEIYLNHVGAQIKLSRMPPMDAQSLWMFAEARWVN